MPESLPLLVVLIIVALGFGVANGFNDAANAIAIPISTRVLSPRSAIALAAVLNLAGALTGIKVAETIGKGILVPEAVTLGTVFAGTAAAVVWVVIATYYGMPISVTHSLVAGLVGAGIAAVGTEVVVWGVLGKVLTAVVSAPFLGFVAGFGAMVGLLWLLRKVVPDRVRTIFSKLQVLSAAFMAYSHGKNDGQMPMGLIALSLMLYYGWEEFHVPWPVILVSAAAISLGTAVGGWRVIRTVGLRITTLRPVHGFAAQTSAATVIEVASHLGIPVSTTHCVSTSIMGVGATRRLSAVRWGVAGNIVIAWVLTFPICAALGWAIAAVARLLA